MTRVTLFDLPRMMRETASPRRTWWQRLREWWADRRLERAMKRAEKGRESGV